MPKLSKIQANFGAGEVSQNVYGRVDSDRYDTSLAVCLNYIPILQGPLIRRSGTKYVANVKDSAKPPTLIPFNYNGTQSYVLEFGDKYIRFFANDGQVLTSSNQFRVSGLYGNPLVQGVLSSYTIWPFTASRPDVNPRPGEFIINSSGTNSSFYSTFQLVPAGSVLEIDSPYTQQDVAQLRYVQQQDTMFITHPAYPEYKLQRMGSTYFDLKPLYKRDGPYLPLNSYRTIGDSLSVGLVPTNAAQSMTLSTFKCQIAGTSGSVGGPIQIKTVTTHPFNTGDSVYVSAVLGTTEANNGTSSIQASYWTARYIDPNTVELLGSVYANPVVGSTGFIFQAMFAMQSTTPGQAATWYDRYFTKSANPGDPQTLGGRNIGLYNTGTRYWGTITDVIDPAHVKVLMGQGQILPNTSAITVWQLGSHFGSNFPSVCTFHQNRLILAGQPFTPQELDGSYIGDYENFAASGSNLQVTDANAFQFSILSNEASPIYWMKSVTQGLLLGTFSSEWQCSPNTQSPGLTPTNFSAQKLSAFGSANADAVQISNSVLYIQAAQRRLREMNYFVQVGSFRSTNLSEMSEHLTLPSVNELAIQHEPHPVVWGVRGDGQLISLTYSRDDSSLKSGFARHILGGQSDTTGTPPNVKSITIATASSGLHNELWMTVSRTMNGSSYVSVEYMTRTFADNALQEDAYYLDCGATFDQPLPVTAITKAASCVVTSPSHGLTNSSLVRFYTTFGVNTSVIDVNGNTTITNLLNGKTFTVASSSTNAFKIQDSLGNDISSQSYSAYLGSSVIRKLVTNVSGLTWLKGDTVNVLADGGIHPPVVVDSSGSIHLAFPAAKVHVGYGYNSDAQLLRTKEGSAQGTSIGSTRRVNRVAFMLHNVAEISYGATFTDLLPVEFPRAGVTATDSPTLITDGVYRENISAPYTYDDAVCFRQSAPLPGTIQAVVRFLEENDV